jgi:hypothetical protein
MGSIDTEEAARRLARVILSDIELYNRERPRPGETLEAQIEEGRRLFKSRVTPDLLPVFGLVLADRAAGSVKWPAVAEPPSTGASAAAATLGPDQASPASNPAIEDLPTPAPSIAAQALEDERTPGPAPSIAAQALEDERTPAPAFAAPPVVDQPGIGASVPATPVAEDERTPAPAFAAPPVVDQPGIGASVPATPLAKEAPALVAQARPIAPQAHEIPIPVLTARVSIPRLFAVAALLAATGAVIYHFLP